VVTVVRLLLLLVLPYLSQPLLDPFLVGVPLVVLVALVLGVVLPTQPFLFLDGVQILNPQVLEVVPIVLDLGCLEENLWSVLMLLDLVGAVSLLPTVLRVVEDVLLQTLFQYLYLCLYLHLFLDGVVILNPYLSLSLFLLLDGVVILNPYQSQFLSQQVVLMTPDAGNQVVDQSPVLMLPNGVGVVL